MPTPNEREQLKAFNEGGPSPGRERRKAVDDGPPPKSPPKRVTAIPAWLADEMSAEGSFTEEEIFAAILKLRREARERIEKRKHGNMPTSQEVLAKLKTDYKSLGMALVIKCEDKARRLEERQVKPPEAP